MHPSFNYFILNYFQIPTFEFYAKLNEDIPWINFFLTSFVGQFFKWPSQFHSTGCFPFWQNSPNYQFHHPLTLNIIGHAKKSFLKVEAKTNYIFLGAGAKQHSLTTFPIHFTLPPTFFHIFSSRRVPPFQSRLFFLITWLISPPAQPPPKAF